MADSESRAVSQVVAIALLVAIVTLLAGTMAVYMGSFSDMAGDTTPNVVIRTTFNDTLEGNGQYLNLTHDGGQTVDTTKLRLAVTGAETVSPSGGATVESGLIESQVGSEWTATETVVIDRRAFKDARGNDLTGGTQIRLEAAVVRLVFVHGTGEQTSILYECNVAHPDCENREN